MSNKAHYKCFCGSIPKRIFGSVACMNEKCPLHAKSFLEKEWDFIHEAIPLQHTVDCLREIFKDTCVGVTVTVHPGMDDVDSVLIEPIDQQDIYQYFGSKEEYKTIDDAVDSLLKTLPGEKH